MIEFITKGVNSDSLELATRQQDQILYLINSKIQDNRTDSEYIKQWMERKFQTNNFFLNWAKSIFKSENFITFFKYLRYPLPSAKLIKNEVEPQLRRVFNAEDAYFKYEVNGKETADFIEDLNIKEFDQDIFKALIYNYNSIIVSDADPQEPNKAHRYIVNIDKVKSIRQNKGTIKQIAFAGYGYDEDGNNVSGTIYIDDKVYQLYNKENVLIKTVEHDLGICPVHFISDEPFSDDYVVKESLFSFIREQLEEYVFMKTLQRMTEMNGAIPVVSKLETEDITDTTDIDSEYEPSADNVMSSQRAGLFNQNPPSGSGIMQPGTVHEIPLEDITDDNGQVNMDIVRNYLNFYNIPVDILNYINDRVAQLKRSIISGIVGDVVDSSEESKNELQIKKSISVLENVLSSFAQKLNRIRALSDRDMLAIEFGRENVRSVSIHYGTDFFLETQEQLFNEFEKAPNSLERKNIIVRINQNRYKNNVDTQTRNGLLYDLIPYVSDKDFEVAKEFVSNEVFEYQTRFNYWISQFEATYGNIVSFYQDMQGDKSQKLKLINDLVIKIIQNESNLVRDNQSDGVQ